MTQQPKRCEQCDRPYEKGMGVLHIHDREFRVCPRCAARLTLEAIATENGGGGGKSHAVPDIGKLTGGPDARAQHCFFAYQALPNTFFRDPVRTIQHLTARPEDAFRLWNAAGDLLQQKGQPRMESSTTITAVERRLADDITLVTVVMPEPKDCPEAYYVSMLFRPATGGLKQPVARFFALEKQSDLLRLFEEGDEKQEPHSSGAVLCEICPRGTHLNHGSGPEPQIHDFEQAVLNLVTEQARLTG